MKLTSVEEMNVRTLKRGIVLSVISALFLFSGLLRAEDLNNKMVSQAREAWIAGNEEGARNILQTWSNKIRDTIRDRDTVGRGYDPKRKSPEEIQVMAKLFRKEGFGEKLNDENLNFYLKHVGYSFHLYAYVDTWLDIFEPEKNQKRNLIRRKIDLDLETLKEDPEFSERKAPKFVDIEISLLEVISRIGINDGNVTMINYKVIDQLWREVLDKEKMEYDYERKHFSMPLMDFACHLNQFHQVLDLFSEEGLLLISGLTKDEINNFISTAEGFIIQKDLRGLKDYILDIKEKADKAKKEALKKFRSEDASKKAK